MKECQLKIIKIIIIIIIIRFTSTLVSSNEILWSLWDLYRESIYKHFWQSCSWIRDWLYSLSSDKILTFRTLAGHKFTHVNSNRMKWTDYRPLENSGFNLSTIFSICWSVFSLLVCLRIYCQSRERDFRMWLFLLITAHCIHASPQLTELGRLNFKSWQSSTFK